ncbi:uncharacterized protein EI90DRAFT_3071453, partial [Cantharellus anzutake]|uniref:uncharacterized protein n=1 Tax=Cantharellus anzutake TaxID=1750568 RepID=UPI0019067772
MEPNHQAIPTHSEDSKDEISLESRKYFHINDLPVELLREIFVTLKADWNRYYSSDGCTVAHVITMICRFWRFVALSEPRLWATFWFSECLKRSKDVHLELMVNFVGDKRYPSRQFRRRVKEIATPHLHRCTSLYIIDYDFRLPNDWIPLPNELKSLRDVAIVLDISPLRFPHPPHQTMDLGLPKRFRYLKLYTPSQCIPAFTSDSVMEHLSVSLGEDQINTAASLLRDVEPLKTLDFELATSPNLDISGIFPRSFPQLENLILRGGRVSSPIVAPRLKHLYCQTPKRFLKGLISLEVRASNLPPDCLVHCHALECLGVYVTADESIRMLESLLSTARPPGLDLSAYHCPNLQRI